MKLTHQIYYGEMDSTLDLKTMSLSNAQLKLKPFYCIHWREFGGLCQLFKSGKLIFHCSHEIVQQYIQVLHRYGNVLHLRLGTQSAIHTLSKRVDYYKLCKQLGDVRYEPEIFHAAILKREGISFTIFHSGKICICGFKTQEDMDEIILPTLLDLELSI